MARMIANAPKQSGDSGASEPPASITSARAGANQIDGAADGDRRGGAGVAIGGRRPGDSQFDRDIARPGAVEDAERQHGIDAARPVRQKFRILLLGKADAAQRGAEADADPVAVLAAKIQAGIRDRHLRGGDRELRELVQPLQLLAVEIRHRIESSTAAAIWVTNGEVSNAVIVVPRICPERSPARSRPRRYRSA